MSPRHFRRSGQRDRLPALSLPALNPVQPVSYSRHRSWIELTGRDCVYSRFGRECYLDSDYQVVCSCPRGYEGQRCEVCAPGFQGNPLVPGDFCKPGKLQILFHKVQNFGGDLQFDMCVLENRVVGAGGSWWLCASVPEQVQVPGKLSFKVISSFINAGQTWARKPPAG